MRASILSVDLANIKNLAIMSVTLIQVIPNGRTSASPPGWNRLQVGMQDSTLMGKQPWNEDMVRDSSHTRHRRANRYNTAHTHSHPMTLSVIYSQIEETECALTYMCTIMARLNTPPDRKSVTGSGCWNPNRSTQYANVEWVAMLPL
jgi:hypothetical protein